MRTRVAHLHARPVRNKQEKRYCQRQHQRQRAWPLPLDFVPGPVDKKRGEDNQNRHGRESVTSVYVKEENRHDPTPEKDRDHGPVAAAEQKYDETADAEWCDHAEREKKDF